MSAGQEARAAERADVLAYLRQQRSAASGIAVHNPAEADRALEIVRSVTIQIEWIEAGLHEGGAAVAAQISGGSHG